MITFMKMKYREWKLKLAFYSMVEYVINEREDIIKTVVNIYESFKGVTEDELQNKLIAAVAEIVHAEAEKERNKAE